MVADRAPHTLAEDPSPEAQDRLDREHMLEGLKPAINAFLWQHLPQVTTLGKADEIARRWFAEIAALWGED